MECPAAIVVRAVYLKFLLPVRLTLMDVSYNPMFSVMCLGEVGYHPTSRLSILKLQFIVPSSLGSPAMYQRG